MDKDYQFDIVKRITDGPEVVDIIKNDSKEIEHLLMYETKQIDLTKYNDIEYWEYQTDMNYIHSMVHARKSNDNFKFLGNFSNIRECIQMAIKDEKNTYQNVVYTLEQGPSDKQFFNSCYANYRGR